jgi:hypothetical protein
MDNKFCILAIRKVTTNGGVSFNAWTCYGAVSAEQIWKLRKLLISEYGNKIIAFALIKKSNNVKK